MVELRCSGTNCKIGSVWEIYFTVVPWNRIGLKLNFPLEKRGVSRLCGYEECAIQSISQYSFAELLAV